MIKDWIEFTVPYRVINEMLPNCPGRFKRKLAKVIQGGYHSQDQTRLYVSYPEGYHKLIREAAKMENTLTCILWGLEAFLDKNEGEDQHEG